MFRKLAAATVIAMGTLLPSTAIAWTDPPFNVLVYMDDPVIACDTIEQTNQAIEAMINDDEETLSTLFRSIDNKEPMCVKHAFESIIFRSEERRVGIEWYSVRVGE